VTQRVGPSFDELASSGLPPSHLKRWLREPLLHFLLAGLALFAGYRVLHPDVNGRDSSDRIVLTEDDLRQMKVAWLGQGRSSLTTEEMRRLIESKVREEILYREALALGLNQGDTIVKRRLAQKMEFLAEDLTAVRDPTTVELQTWFEKNRERFALPPRLSFRHLYFSPDRRGTRAKEAAASTRERLARKPADSPASASVADSFMFQDSYRDRTLDQVADVFGTTFATALFHLTPGSWQGPIESGLGWHVAWVESITAGRVPSFEEIEHTVKSAWIEEQRAESRRQAFDAMKARYEVILPKPQLVDGLVGDTTEAKAVP